MKARKIAEDIWWVGATDWDRRLFDSLIPLPDGTSYNSYFIQGTAKSALIDAVDPMMKNVLFDRLKNLKISSIDYIIANHIEQDHSGSIPDLLSAFPKAMAITSKMGKGLMMDMLAVPEDRILVVEDGETVNLGGRTLQFIYFPWVHWPETMLTWLPQEKILFPCDLFGSHLATADLFVSDPAAVLLAAKRYYAEIMMPFSTTIMKNFQKANIIVAFIGIESPSQNVLLSINKKQDFRLALETQIDTFIHHGILPYLSFIIGLDEEPDDILDKFKKFIDSCCSPLLQINVINPVIGSKFRDKILTQGRLLIDQIYYEHHLITMKTVRNYETVIKDYEDLVLWSFESVRLMHYCSQILQKIKKFRDDKIQQKFMKNISWSLILKVIPFYFYLCFKSKTYIGLFQFFKINFKSKVDTVYSLTLCGFVMGLKAAMMGEIQKVQSGMTKLRERGMYPYIS